MTTRTVQVQVISDAGSPTVLNQDRAGQAFSSVWVIDGATPLGPSVTPGGDDAVWLADTLDMALKTVDSSSGSQADSLREVLRSVAAAYASYLPPGAENASDRLPPSAGLAWARWTPTSIEYLLLGDCSLSIIPDGDGAGQTLLGSEVLPALDAKAIQVMSELRRMTGRSFAEARAAIQPLLIDHRRQANVPGGYGVCSPDPRSVDFAVTGSIPRSGVAGLLLASDGFSRLWDTLALYISPRAVFEALEHGDPADLVRALRAAEAADAEAVRYPRFKVHDDASMVCVRGL